MLKFRPLLRRQFLVPSQFQVRFFQSIPSPDDFDPKKEPVKLPLKERIKHEFRHYWEGTKKLGKNIYVSRQLIKRMSQKESLSWREERLLRQTTKDVLITIPFATLVLVPLSEFFLPFLIKFCPWILPSTYEGPDQRMNKLKQMWKSRLQIANVFQKSIREIMIEKIKDKTDASEFQTLLDKLNQKEYLENGEIILLGKVLGNRFKLGNLNTDHLKKICGFFNLSTYGPDFYLRNSLRNYLDQLNLEDRKISLKEIDELPISLLMKLNQERGMRIVSRNEEHLRKQLRDWVELSCSGEVPSYLLLISRSCNYLGEHITVNSEQVEELIEESRTAEPQVIENVTAELKEIETVVEKLKEKEKENDEDEKEKEAKEAEKDEALEELLEETEKEEEVNNQLKEMLDDDPKIEKMNQIPEKMIDKVEEKMEQLTETKADQK